MYFEFGDVGLCDELRDGGQRPSIWKGAIAGATGGLIASWVMNQFQAGVSKAAEKMSDGTDSQRSSSGGEDATVKTASAISKNVAGHHLTPDEKKVAGPAVHYAFGSTMGALYGIAAELTRKSSTAWGMPFGAALWLGADEVAIPALGLSGESQPKISTHASAFAAHLVYGLTTDSVRRLVRMALK